MTKTQLIEKVAMQTGLSKKEVGEVCDAIFVNVADSLAAGESAQIAGFGVFAAKERAARTRRNPKTGEPVEVAACRAPVFTASKSLKDKINEA